jgi:hypothetical protein
MDRRKALRIVGYSLSSAALLGWGAGCRDAVTVAGWVPNFHTVAEGAFLAQLGEAFLPATEIPGAEEVGAHVFVDRFVDQVFDQEDQTAWRTGLDLLRERWRDQHQQRAHDLLRELLNLPEAEQQEVKSLLRKTPAAGSPTEARYYTYRTLFRFKELIMLGYFASKPIGEDVLAFLPTPGRYDPCIPYAEIGRVWSL